MINRNNIKSLDKGELLKRAKKHYFSLGIGDGACSLCRTNFYYGLAKIHYLQDALGINPNATFISTPDETISRNKNRWISGYGYGGKLCWNDDPNDKLIVIDTKPNCCGMLLGGIDEIPDYATIIKNMNKMISEDYYIDNIKIKWDFKKGNHFIDIFKIKQDKNSLYANSSAKLNKYAFIIHGSVPELRSETDYGIGLYWDKSKALEEALQRIETPFGEIKYIEGNIAKEYLEFHEKARNFAARKRELVAKLLFGKFDVISNPIHQGLKGYNTMLLGAQTFKDEEYKLFPIALRSDLPAFIASGKNSLNEEIIDDLGFEKRAKNLGAYERLVEFNTLPHGGGYTIPHISKVQDVNIIDGERYFICEQENEEATSILSDVSETQYMYRGKSVINKVLDLELGKMEAKMMPKFVLKV